MAVFRIEKTRDYTVMSNYHLRDMSLSLKAKGLLSLMLSLPENWDYTMKGLSRICKDGIDSISGGIRELEAHGYLIRERIRNENGQLGAIEYTILEQPKRMPANMEALTKKYAWSGEMVRRILTDEAYTGTLICHKSERNKINKTFHFTESHEQCRHEDFLPQIITKELWEQVQELVGSRRNNHVRAGTNQPILRYSGLLECGDCRRGIFGKRIQTKAGQRVEYTCSGHHRYGKDFCTKHTVREEYLDELIYAELLSTKSQYQKMWDALEKSRLLWTPKETTTASKIVKLKKEIDKTEEEMEVILMERIRDKANAQRYDRMLEKREKEIVRLKAQIEELENLDQTIRTRQAKLKKDISFMDEILADGTLTEAHLRMLIEKIYVYETETGISLDIHIKAPFQNHTDAYENGKLIESILEKVG